MASINNQFGLLSAPKAIASQPINFGSYKPTATTATPQSGLMMPKTTMPTNSQPLSGLVSPQHPTGQPASSTITTNPDMSTQHKITYVQPSAPSSSQPQQNQQPQSQTGGPAIPTAINQYEPNQGMFGQVASGLANTAAVGSPTSTQAQQGLMSTAQNNPLEQGGAYQAYQSAVDNLSKLKQAIAAKYAGTESQPIPLEFQQGQEQVLARQYASQLDAAQQAVNQAQQALGYGIQEQGQQQTGFNQAGSLANTAQGLEQSGLTSAGQLAQPSGNYPFVFNPTTGGFTQAGGTGNILDVQQATQMALNGGYNQALSGLGYLGPTAEAQLQASILASNPKADINALKTQSAAKTQNIMTTGTAGTTAANTAYQSAVQGVAAATKQYTSLAGISDQLNSTLATWGNSGILTNYNQAINTLASVTSNPDYQRFVTALANTQAQYASILGSAGVIPTQATQDALKVLNPSSSATAINAALNQLSKDAHAILVVPAYQQQKTYGSQLGIQ